MFSIYLDELQSSFPQYGLNAVASRWFERALIATREAIRKNGNSPVYARSLAALPAIPIGHRELTTRVAALAEVPLSDADESALREVLSQFKPWRKGPFDLAGVYVDAEWRSDRKWSRVSPHLADLSHRRVLDVGCGNGYYTWRMLGAGASLVVGLDPALLCLAQFLAVRTYLGSRQNPILALGSESLDVDLHWFDTVFSMGVLYHRRDPLAHLRELRRALRRDGELVLETLVIDGGMEVFNPPGRYAQMRNVHSIPSCLTVEHWLAACGFSAIRLVDRTLTTVTEQRSTAWSTTQSLADFLDPRDSSRTVEGHPAPLRAIFVARAA